MCPTLVSEWFTPRLQLLESAYIRCADNLHDSSAATRRVIEQFDQMAEEFGFVTIDATRSVDAVFADLRRHIEALQRSG